MLVLLMLLLLLLVFLVLLNLDTSLLLQLPQAKRVGQVGLVRSLFLLLDGEKRVLADLCSQIASSVGILCCDEVLVRSSNLQSISL